MNGDEVYLAIGEMLFSIAPNEAKFVVVDAEISKGNDHCKFLFDYIDAEGKKDWFSPPSSRVDSDLFDCLLLKKEYSEKGLVGDFPVWVGCELSFNVERSKLSIDFRYE
ncbi:hypothetical protein [Pseudomonas vanderleydeniana]|uniref:Uncharacterized protein n=1 Tax=Pseudomonas vanderleydeniana TaxID=2745495 RepID=A0A9E6TTM3_9PSED|nr:hypothetical protein [Pseudomonas vanderleydeniana]QXI29954.1 hypothetical protein HU752_008380 [Pseudomonas vanderleydeniana]